MSLAELSRVLERDFDGKLGRRSSSILSEVMSRMIPPSISSTEAREHLLDQWGLGPGSQDSILMILASNPPVVRYASDREAMESLDHLARRYGTDRGVHLEHTCKKERTSQNRFSTPSVIAISTSRCQDSGIASFEICNQLLRERIQDGDIEALHLQTQATKLLGLMGTWKVQHVPKAFDEFAAAFDRREIQRFDSSGNWALQDLYTLVYDVMVGRSGISRMEIDHQASLLSNRANSNLLRTVAYLRTKYSTTGAVNSRQSMEVVLQRLMDYFEQAL